MSSDNQIDFLVNDAVREAVRRGREWGFKVDDAREVGISKTICVPYSVFREAVERANEKAYRPSEGLKSK